MKKLILQCKNICCYN